MTEMNDIQNIGNDIPIDVPKPTDVPSDIQAQVCESKDMLNSITDYVQDAIEKVSDTFNDVSERFSDLINGKSDIKEDNSDAQKDFREYGLDNCTDAAEQVFTSDVISNWGNMDVDTRNKYLQDYTNKIGEGLDINLTGLVWDVNDPYTYGYNQGDGYIHLNPGLISDPAQIMQLVNTIAHEARHQLQREACDNPEKYGLDDATRKEWMTGFENYTSEAPTAYDPWGYTFNPVEIDARYFGESVVRGLTKDLINNN